MVAIWTVLMTTICNILYIVSDHFNWPTFKAVQSSVQRCCEHPTQNRPSNSVCTCVWLHWKWHMVKSLNGNIFRVSGPLWGSPVDSTPSDAELWCFLWPAPEQTVEQTIETSDLRRHRAHYNVTVMHTVAYLSIFSHSYHSSIFLAVLFINAHQLLHYIEIIAIFPVNIP